MIKRTKIEKVQRKEDVQIIHQDYPTWLEPLRHVVEHGVRLHGALEAVVEGELAAHDVKVHVRVGVEVGESALGAVGGDEVAGEDAAAISEKKALIECVMCY